jgi:hypothetical protein
MKGTFRFYRTANRKWFLDLPDWGGSIDDLEMIRGADIMLDMLSGDREECYLEMSDDPFDGSEVLELVKDLRGTVGGGEYFFETYQQEIINYKIWFCEITEVVFGELPKRIYLQTVNKKTL